MTRFIWITLGGAVLVIITALLVTASVTSHLAADFAFAYGLAHGYW